MTKEKLTGFETGGIFEFHEEYFEPVTIENRKIKTIDFSVAHFYKPVTFDKCTIDKFILFGTTFVEGLEINNCTIAEKFLFQSGGYNKNNFSIKIENTLFRCLADFEDCYFIGEVHIENVKFIKGSNLLGNKNTPVEVGFEQGIIIKNVEGDLKINSLYNT